MISERDRPSHFTVYRDAEFLSHCSPDEARHWLKSRPVEYSGVFGHPETPSDSHVLEYVLYRRDLPLIDLALAEYGRSRSVLERVYRRGSSGVKVTACSNPSLFNGDKLGGFDFWNQTGAKLWHIVRKGPLPELRAVCENPGMSSGFYESLLSSWEGDKDSERLSGRPLSSERFKNVLHFLSGNPRVSQSREDSKERYYWDGHSEWQYDRLFDKGWLLAEIVPVDNEWALALSKLYRNLRSSGDVYDDVGSVLERWRSDAELIGSPTVNLREEIAAKLLKPSIDMLQSDDPAIRNAFYRTFDPESKEFRRLDWTQWLQRDEHCKIWLDTNQRIWRSSEGRERLAELETYMSLNDLNSSADLGFSKQREDMYRKEHPEWFSDEVYEEDEILSEDDETQMSRRMADLERSINKLAETTAEHRPIGWFWILAAALIGSMVGASF